MISELTGSMGGVLSPAMIHAEGSIAASLIALAREYDFGSSKSLVSAILEHGRGRGLGR